MRARKRSKQGLSSGTETEDEEEEETEEEQEGLEESTEPNLAPTGPTIFQLQAPERHKVDYSLFACAFFEIYCCCVRGSLCRFFFCLLFLSLFGRFLRGA